MPLVATLGNRPDGYPTRHYFFEMGPSSCIAFFEWPGFDNGFYKPAGQPFRGPLQFDHLSFDLETEEELLELQDRLEKAGVGVTTVIDHKVIHSITSTTTTASPWKLRCGSPILPATLRTTPIPLCSKTRTRCPLCARRWSAPDSSRPARKTPHRTTLRGRQTGRFWPIPKLKPTWCY